MKRLISYGSIGQFRHAISYINKLTALGETPPKLHVIGSEKIHGTNAAVCFSEPDGFWVQSKNNIITPDSDHFNCATIAYENKDIWLTLIKKHAADYNIDLDTHVVTIFFEWAGGNIAKNTAISTLTKRAIIFRHFKVSPIEDDRDDAGNSIGTSWKLILNNNFAEREMYADASIFFIDDFDKVELDIDFSAPATAQNKMIEFVEAIEQESKVGKAMGKDGNIGEGYVFTVDFKGEMIRFKVKGNKHANKCKVKTLSPADVEQEQKIISFVNEHACPAWRMDQMFEAISNDVHNITEQQTGDYIRYVVADILKEESDIMAERGITTRMIGKPVSVVARQYFFERLNAEMNL